MLRTRLCCILCPLAAAALAVLYMLFAAPSAHAQPKGPVSFIKDVAPILKENCYACHDAKKKKGKLDMTTYETFRKGGVSDDPVTPGDAKKSRLVEVLISTGKDRMPPKDVGDALPKEKIEIISAWIAAGAKLDDGISAKADLLRELRQRWAPPPPPAAYKFPVNINALVFTPDNKQIVVGGNHELTVWDVATSKLVKRLHTRAERAKAMAFLPDGKLAVAGGRPGQEGDVRIYNLGAAGQMKDGIAVLDGVNDKTVLIAALVETDDEMLALAVSKDGKKLACGGCDRLVRVWDISGGVGAAKLEQSFENHADWVFAVAFSPDGNQLLTGSRDKTAKLWDLKTKESLLTFPDHQSTVYAVSITDDGATGISVADDKNLRYWQATDKAKAIGKQVRAVGGHGMGVFRIATFADPKNPLLATCSADKTVRLWNTNTGAAGKTLGGFTDWVYAVAISPDGKLVAGGAWNGEVRVFKTDDGKEAVVFNASPGYTPPAVVAPKK